MKITIAKIAVPAVLLSALFASAPSFAHDASINARLGYQQHRINAGARDHQLTRREQYNLDARDSRIRILEDHDRSRDDGHLTSAERRNLERDLNRTSHSIYRDRRNGN